MKEFLHYDVIVLGAGPAGCLAAAGVKRNNPNLSVAVIDKDLSPHHRIGEALLTGTISTLSDAGLLDVVVKNNFHRKIGAAYLWGEDRTPWYVNYPVDESFDLYPDSLKDEKGRYTVHVPRDIFDDELRKEISRKHDIAFIEAKVVGVKTSGRRNVQVTSIQLDTGAEYKATYWIDATGQSSVLGNKVTTRRKVWTPRTARYGYYRNVDWNKAQQAGFHPHRTNILSSKNGWIWVIHLGDPGRGLTSIGVVSQPDITKQVTPENIVDMFPELSIFGIGEPGTDPCLHDDNEKVLDHFYVHPDYSYKCDELNGNNWALCGDAAVFLDPILSQGVTLAAHYGFMRGLAAADHLSGNRQAQNDVTYHYLNEASILKVAIESWYSNNNSVKDWQVNLENVAPDQYADTNDLSKTFRWVTNLENLHAEYKVYPDSEQIKINRALGVEVAPVDELPDA